LALLLAGCGGGSNTTPGELDGATTGDGDNGDGASQPDTEFEFDTAVDETGEAAPCATAKTCAGEGANCGPISDGCGGVLDCGTCTSGETCGGGGTPSVCGKPPCTPKTCASLGLNCGPAGDGCGAALDCGTCSGADTCGGGGEAGKCGHVVTCTPKTCADQSIECGPAGDGCGKALDCGTCSGGTSCGGGGVSGVCGKPPCTPTTCAAKGANCGPVADGCGGLLSCGTCSAPQTCGGGGIPNFCQTPSTCTNLCLKQTTCPTAGATTSVSGTVYAPNGVDPLPNVLVYVPNSTVAPFGTSVACETCGASVSGSPLVKTTTAVDGTFKLTNMPVGTNIPLVIQIGRWRRQITIANVPSCTNTVLTAAQTRLPKTKAEGDIPKMAFVTGSVDALECVMRKIGVADSEFTSGSGAGRINLYTGSGGPGATISGATSENSLTQSATNLAKYDVVFFPCQAAPYTSSHADATSRANLVNYANAGGRVFATHYSYVWLNNQAPFTGTATWAPDSTPPSPDPQTGFIDMTFPKGLLLAQWLKLPAIGASTTLGQISLNTLRKDFTGVVAPSQLWMTVKNPAVTPMHYTFNTPVGAAADKQCGRVLYDDFHVYDGVFSGTTFPNECGSGTAMSPQEKLLEFMIFDLTSCVTSDTPTCTPNTCAAQGISCGPAGDGCGNVLACGDCPAGKTCGGGGTPSVCGAPSCTPKTCAAQGFNCGPAGDGCGNLLDCGTCPSGQTCGGGGKPGVCGSASCTPRTCAAQGFNCGPAGDGCGNKLDCGTCPSGQTCGGGGTPGVCGAPACTPKTCASMGFNCGPAGDGCGHLLDCGTCTLPQTCGGGGTPNVCGGGGPA
jgi:hypothetical protein